jgi:hypothetical protein
MTPFELRYQMFQTAKDMLENEYHAKKNFGEEIEYPSLEKIVKIAKELNSFVSEK